MAAKRPRKASGQKASNQKSSGKNKGGSRRKKKTGKVNAVNATQFWGAKEDLPDADVEALVSTYPQAIVKSLGRPPLSGHQNASEHYFAAVYERTVVLGSALAAAGDLIEAEELTR